MQTITERWPTYARTHLFDPSLPHVPLWGIQEISQMGSATGPDTPSNRLRADIEPTEAITHC